MKRSEIVVTPLDSRIGETPGAMYRWGQLLMGLVCMAMVANLQYGWTLFVNPLSDRFGWSNAAIQVAFSVFVVAQTLCVPIAGFLVDESGPRPVVLGGGLLTGGANFSSGIAVITGGSASAAGSDSSITKATTGSSSATASPPVHAVTFTFSSSEIVLSAA